MGAGVKRSDGGRRHRPMGEINVTPFVDVMLVLLIVFMVTAPLLTVGVEVDLPKTKAGAINAAIYAAKILSLSNNKLKITLDKWISNQKSEVPNSPYQ